MAVDFTSLGAQLQALMPKTAQRTEEQLTAAATSKYTPIYNAEVEGATQTQQKSDLALAQQIERLLPEYQRQRESIEQATRQAVSQQGREVLRRGMQRSSYGMATMGGIRQAGIKSLAQAEEQHNMNVGQINAQRAQLEQNLAATLGRLEKDKAHVVSGYTDEMRQQDLANAMQGYQMLQQLQLTMAQEQAAQDRWEAEYELELSKTKRSSGGGSSKKATASTAPAATSTKVSSTKVGNTGAYVPRNA